MSVTSDVAAARAANATAVTSKTTVASIHPADVGGGIDAAMALILECTIDGATSLGDVTNKKVLIGTGSTGSPTSGILISNDNNVYVYFGGAIIAQLGRAGGIPQLALGDAIGSGNKVYVQTLPTLTGIRSQFLSDADGNIPLVDFGSSTQSLSLSLTMTITHGLSYTPNKNRIQLTFGDTPPTLPAGSLYVVSTNSTHIVVGFDQSQTGSVTVNWAVFGGH